MKKTLLSFFMLLFISLSLTAQVSKDSLVAYYPFDGNAYDYSGNELNGEVIGAELTTDRFGVPNSAYYFDGVDDYIDLGKSKKLKPYPPVTISCWIKHDAGEAGIIDNDLHHYNYYGIWLAIRLNREIYLNIGNSGGIGPQSRIGKKILTPGYGEWFHFAGTIDSSLNFTLYINGEKVDAEDFGSGDSLVYGDGNCVLGTFDNNPGIDPDFLEGKLDDFRIYHRVLEDNEIKILAENNYYSLSIDTLTVANTGQVVVPVNLEVPANTSFSSFELSLSGYSEYADFASVINDESTITSDNWTIQANEDSGIIRIAGISSNAQSSSGTLLKLKLNLKSSTTSSRIPMVVDSVIFDTGSIPVKTSDGEIIVIDPEDLPYGDVDFNNNIQAYDGSLILKHLVDKIELSQLQMLAADVSLDSTVSAYDASLILKYITKIIDQLPYVVYDSLNSQNIELSMPDINISDNNQILIPLYMQSAAKINSMELELTFDPDLLEFDSIKKLDALNNFTIDYNQVGGTIKFASYGSQINIENQPLINIVFNQKNISTFSDDITLSKIRINEEKTVENAAVSHIITDIIDENQIPVSYSLAQNYPNPFNPATEIVYTIPQNSFVTLKVYNALGQLIKTLVNDNQAAGKYSVSFNASNLSSGTYFYRIVANGYTETKKMLLIK